MLFSAIIIDCIYSIINFYAKGNNYAIIIFYVKGNIYAGGEK
jgi:hypothetical protein